MSAVAAVEGKLDFYRLHEPEGVITPAVAKMQQKIRFTPRDDWTGSEHNRHAIVKITTTAGKELQEDVWFRPMTRSELEEKFNDLVEPRFGAERTAHLKALLGSIENAASIRPLMAGLRASS